MADTRARTAIYIQMSGGYGSLTRHDDLNVDVDTHRVWTRVGARVCIVYIL